MSGESAPLLDDELFGRSQKWKLSTSGLSAGLLFKGTGFGSVYEDGYGINCACLSFIRPGGFLTFGGVHWCRFGSTRNGEVWDGIQVFMSKNIN